MDNSMPGWELVAVRTIPSLVAIIHTLEETEATVLDGIDPRHGVRTPFQILVWQRWSNVYE